MATKPSRITRRTADEKRRVLLRCGIRVATMCSGVLALRDPVASEVFKTWMPCAPERVWAAFTCPVATTRILGGLSASSAWQPGSPMTMSRADTVLLTGTVLRAVPPSELAFSLDDPSGTSTLLSLRLRPLAEGCVVTLNVDEFPASSCGVELEDLWLPILERLREEVVASRRS